VCAFCWNIQDMIYEKSMKFKPNVTLCKKLGTLNVGLVKRYVILKRKIVWKIRLSDCEETLCSLS